MNSRRQFLQIAFGAAGVAALGGMRINGLSAGEGMEEARPASKLKSFQRKSFALGAEISLTVLHENEFAARRALDAAFGELETVESVMSIYRPESELSRLNRDGIITHPHPYLLSILRTSLEISRLSGGAFDVTVQPLWDLYMEAKKAKALPEDSAIEAARQKVGWKKIALSDSEVRVEKGTRITLNGIAQGYAADRCAEMLKSLGIEHALLDTGEIRAIGDKSGTPWSAAIQHPRRPDAYVALARLDGVCLATSGDYATTFSNDFVYHHIFDPATGRSPLLYSSVSIVAPNATEADALTKVVFVGGETGLKQIAARGASAFLVAKDGKTFATSDFPLAS